MTVRVVLYPRRGLTDQQVRAWAARAPIDRPWVDRIEIEQVIEPPVNATVEADTRVGVGHPPAGTGNGEVT